MTQPIVLVIDRFTEFTDHLAVRKILPGVRDRAEGHVESFWWRPFEFAMLVRALFAFVAAMAMMLRGPLSWCRWLSGLVAGAAWLIVWYSPISVLYGTVVNVRMCGVLFTNQRGRAARHIPTSQALPQRAT